MDRTKSHAWIGVALLCLATAVLAQTAAPPPPEPVGRKLIEIYRVAPGQHEAFLRAIARFDQANVQGGVPPRQLYVHSDGASWDFILIQDAEYPEGKGDAVGKAYKELGLPSGPRFFTEFRSFILEHTDTFAKGPTTAAAYLAELDATPPSFLGKANAPRYDLSNTIDLGGTPRWDYVQIDAPARRLYVAHDTTVDVVDLDTRRVVGQVKGSAGAHGIALAPELGRGFVADADRDTLTAFSLKTLERLGQVTVGHGPDAVTYEPVSKRVLAFNGDGKSATVIAADTLAVIATLPLGGGPEFGVADGRGVVFVNITDTHEIARIDVAAARVAGRFTLPDCDSPTALAMDIPHRRLYSACRNEVLVAVDADTGRVLGRAPVGSGADAVVFDPRESRLLVSSSDGWLTILGVNADGAPFERTRVPTRATGRTLGLDPKTGALYVPATVLDWDWETRTAKFAQGGLKLYVYEPVR